MDIKEEVAELSDKLRAWQKAYYVDDHPLVSDQEYDRLFDRLSQLEKEHPELRRDDSPTVRVGSDLTSDFPEVRHTIPVLSLDKAYSSEAILSWIQKCEEKMDEELSFVIEEKIDGVSMVLYYEDGVLVRGVTRGNGTVGNDVTPNIKTIPSIPLRLPEPVTMAVRGEVYLPKAPFAKLNAQMDPPYANPRNLAAGTIRRIHSSETAKVPLNIFVYEGFWQGNRPFDDHIQILETLKQYGFRTNPTIGYFCKSKEEAEARLKKSGLSGQSGSFSDIPAYIAERTRSRKALPYEIDGLVVKINEISVREVFGYTGHHPRWAIAYKFEAPQAQTVLNGIDVQVGRTGRITPVARVTPTEVGGSTVSNVTLHNQDYVDQLELAIGDTVEISKRGDVIPAVERVIEKNELGNPTWKMPPLCPCCHTPLVRRGAHTFCPNPLCPDQIRGRVEFFIGKEQMDIETFGPETAGLLIDKGVLKDIQDIYTIDYAHVLADEPGFGEKKITSIIEGVRESKKQPFHRVLVSLGIPEIGKKVVDLLIKNGLSSMDELLSVAKAQDYPRLTSISQIGEKTAKCLFDGLLDPLNQQRIEGLRSAGLAMEEKSVTTDLPQTFAGQVWCVTGSFEHFNPRSKAMEEVEKRGGRTVSAVSAKTTHLLVGKGGGSKAETARALGVKLVNEEQFLALLGQAQSSGEGQGDFGF
ncbi:MAG: NAD-dependent DNA ligase LigA [Sphaerochaeta sp.]|jgi:DNA ligase (NAD+)|nr:NAD-dependent DNA ligase LigA [Sphaerochaeta sp.]MCH3920526.1 NAD-dependent DNA ligase LigA [Sphaerochaeta sp.]MCI2045787.1 NAD-dependent DNA ligase LigA [Sphaerochaeta sp.]MCI2104254.1 NAD-dependent DNA ligase LigA [Sphaerochaeta sp.]